MMSARRRLFVKSSIAVCVLISLCCWVTARRTSYLDYLTGSTCVEYGYWFISWRCPERPGPATAWAASVMDEPERRIWINGCSIPIGPLGGLIYCGVPMNAIGYIWRSALPESAKVEMLREWHAEISAVPDRAAMRKVEREWIERNTDVLGFER